MIKEYINHKHIMTFYLPDSMGWGNVALCLSDLVHRSPNPRAYKSLLDVDRGVEFPWFLKLLKTQMKRNLNHV
jgi:hypothetical protein